MRLALLAFLVVLATACDPDKQAVPDPAQPPKPRLTLAAEGPA